jgi:anti-anti-sigma regulatory factor
MFLATANKTKRLLCLTYVERVLPDELKLARADIQSLLADLPPGFCLLADLSQVTFMDPECATEIGRTMELIDQAGVRLIVRVISDPAKDIGLNILTIFHYPRHPRIITCETLADALTKISL